MAIHSDTHFDLDRTDELPRLDVAAYEAARAAEADGLSRTDTWAVEALQLAQPEEDAGEIDTTLVTPAPLPRGRQVVEPPAPAVTTDVDRILKRIAELEADVESSHALNRNLESVAQSLRDERDALGKRIIALEADNARLGEHRTIAHENLQRLEQQLIEQTQQHAARLHELTAARADEQGAAIRARELLEEQLTLTAANLLELRADHSRMMSELRSATELASRHEEHAAVLQQALAEEQRTTARLSRNLAAKLTEHDAISTLAERRSDAIAARDEEIRQLTAEIERLTVELGAAAQQRNATQDELSHEKELQDRIQHELARSERAIGELRSSLDQARNEAAGLRRELGASNSALTGLQETALTERRALDTVRAELDGAQAELATLRTELIARSNVIVERDEELAGARAAIAQMLENRETLRDLNSQLQQRSDRLQNELTHRRETLDSMTGELANARRELADALPAVRGLEQAIRVRDELIEQLRGELQTAQDERAIMAIQVEKVRARHKTMAQEIFERDSRIAVLRSDLAVHVEALAAIRKDVGRVVGASEAPIDADTLRVLEPVEHDGEAIVLSGKILTIGRTGENDICIPSKLISRHHARLLIGPTGVVVEDAGSTNGCYVNGRSVKQQLMHDGDVLELGDLKYRLATRSPQHTRARDNVVPFADNRRPPN